MYMYLLPLLAGATATAAQVVPVVVPKMIDSFCDSSRDFQLDASGATVLVLPLSLSLSLCLSLSLSLSVSLSLAGGRSPCAADLGGVRDVVQRQENGHRG